MSEQMPPVQIPAVVQPEPDLVQLLTPEGRARRAPGLPAVDQRRRDRRAVPRPRPRPPHRHRGNRAAAPGGARALGQPARPGGRADRRRTRAAPAGHGVPDLPRARRRLVPRGRSADAAGALPRHEPRRLGPGLEQLQPLYDRDRRADPARRGLCDGGRPATGRSAPANPERDTAVITFFGDGASSQGDVNEAFVWAGGGQPAGRLLLPEQPVGDQRTGHHAEPGAAVPTREPGSGSPASGSTATTCWRASPSPARPSTTRAARRAPR